MKNTIMGTLLVAFLVAVLAAASSGEIIRLKNGVELHGELVEFNAEQGVTVKRFDNGGIITLRWEHIVEADATAIKVAHGYGGMEVEPILVKAKRFLLATGDYVIGVPVESDRPGVVTLHRLGKNYPYLHSQVKDVETVEVEAQEVYTAQELYDRQVEGALPETALDHFKLAVFCESIAYYDRALEHFKMAAEQDPDFKPDVVAQKIGQMEVKQAEADATRLLNEIKNRLYKKQFERALAFCDDFAESFPDSRQMGELEKLKAKVLTKKTEFYQQKILTDYFSYLDIIARKVASDKEIKVEDALAYARDEMGGDVRKKLAGLYVMAEEDIETLWLNRKGGRARTVSYGSGTFLLGEEAKEVPEAESDEEEEEKEEEPATVDEKLKKKIEAIKKERAKQSKSRRSRLQIDDIGQKPGQWWRNSDTASRKQILVAFYAEKSGDMKIVRVRFRKCRQCNGRGWFESFSVNQDEDKKDPCPVCKTLAIERIVTYK